MDLGREAAATCISTATASVSTAAASVSAATGCNVGGEPGKGVKTKGNKWRREGMKVGNRKFCCIARSKLEKLLRAVRQRKEGARRSKEQMWGGESWMKRSNKGDMTAGSRWCCLHQSRLYRRNPGYSGNK